ncbi:MAG: hypothetical protein WD118_10880 [Phycisphaeraceae bacterium]
MENRMRKCAELVDAGERRCCVSKSPRGSFVRERRTRQGLVRARATCFAGTLVVASLASIAWGAEAGEPAVTILRD